MSEVHEPFLGDKFQDGIRGKKIAIIGYSHWSSEDRGKLSDFSQHTIKMVMQEKWKPRFFSSIRNTFGYSRSADFWNRVLFFNYAPRLIGTGSQRFYFLMDTEIDEANDRLMRILRQYLPDVVFVFTKKTKIEELGLPFALMQPPLQKFSSAEVDLGGKMVKIVRARHPQGASRSDLRLIVDSTLGR